MTTSKRLSVDFLAVSQGVEIPEQNHGDLALLDVGHARFRQGDAFLPGQFFKIGYAGLQVCCGAPEGDGGRKNGVLGLGRLGDVPHGDFIVPRQ
jgi:hypothetical protein